MQENQYVIFTLGDEDYGIDIRTVQEIIRPTHFTKLPNTPKFVLGVINLRDRIVPIIDLKKRFGLKDSEDNEDNRLIIYNRNDHLQGFLVDNVHEVITLSEEVIEECEELCSVIERQYLLGVAKYQDRLIILLDFKASF